MGRQVERGLWPVDWLLLAYLLADALLIAVFQRRIESAALLLLAHAAAIALILAYAWWKLPGAIYFRNLYPLPYVYACYRVMKILIESLRQTRCDALLTMWDYALWRVHPTVWLERLQTPLAVELLQIVYALFVPAVLVVALLLWLRRRDEYPRYVFLLTLGFLASYALYFVVPARGPRIFLDGLQTRPLAGLWLFGPLRTGLDVLESPHYDCFPSGHVEMTILAWWTARRLSPRLGGIYGVYAVLIALATVYLRYHYTVDLLAGAVVAVLVLAAAPHLLREPRRRERRLSDEQAPDFVRSE